MTIVAHGDNASPITRLTVFLLDIGVIGCDEGTDGKCRKKDDSQHALVQCPCPVKGITDDADNHNLAQGPYDSARRFDSLVTFIYSAFIDVVEHLLDFFLSCRRREHLRKLLLEGVLNEIDEAYSHNSCGVQHPLATQDIVRYKDSEQYAEQYDIDPSAYLQFFISYRLHC